MHSGPLRTEVTAVVVRLPDGSVIRLGNPGTSPVTARVTDTTWDLHGRSLAGWEVDISGYAALGDATRRSHPSRGAATGGLGRDR